VKQKNTGIDGSPSENTVRLRMTHHNDIETICFHKQPKGIKVLTTSVSLFLRKKMFGKRNQNENYI
jgi:hypothetical protein